VFNKFDKLVADRVDDGLCREIKSAVRSLESGFLLALTRELCSGILHLSSKLATWTGMKLSIQLRTRRWTLVLGHSE
jgi:hypothetical protein